MELSSYYISQAIIIRNLLKKLKVKLAQLLSNYYRSRERNLFSGRIFESGVKVAAKQSAPSIRSNHLTIDEPLYRDFFIASSQSDAQFTILLPIGLSTISAKLRLLFVTGRRAFKFFGCGNPPKSLNYNRHFHADVLGYPGVSFYGCYYIQREI